MGRATKCVRYCGLCANSEEILCELHLRPMYIVPITFAHISITCCATLSTACNRLGDHKLTVGDNEKGQMDKQGGLQQHQGPKGCVPALEEHFVDRKACWLPSTATSSPLKTQ